MVELPRYVRRVIKPNGRAFYFYTRHRGTPAAWPAIALPDPLDREFARRLEICEALERAGDAFTLGGQALPDHHDKEFWPKAEKILAGIEAAEHEERKTFTALIATYKAHEAYLKKAPSTRRGYDAYAELVKAAWAHDLVSDLTTVDAQEAIDAMGETPAAGNQFRAFLSRLVSFGVPRGFVSQNVVAFTEKLSASEPWPSWPEWAFEVFFAEAPAHLVLPAVSALFTGQRQSDVIAMPRPKTDEPTMPVRAQKTKQIVWVPIHSEYRRWIEAAPKGDAIQLHIGVEGRPYTVSGFRGMWQKLMRRQDKSGQMIFQRFRDERIVFHGLRKNAVINLLEAGATESEVGAIVNMTEQMVRHYGRDVSVRRLAQNGMKLLESRWAELRPKALPK